MNIELIAIIVMLVVNAVGWGYTLWQNSKSSSKREGKAETKICNLEKQIGALPCNKNSTYNASIGAIQANIHSINDRLSRIENKIFDGGG